MGQQLFIEILAGPGTGERVEVLSERTLIGRGSQCDLRLASPHVSRQQCELIRQGDQLILENLGSVNVTYLNDRPIDRVYIQDGDLITFCDIALRVSLGAAQAGDDPDQTVAYQAGQLPPGMDAGSSLGPPSPPVPIAPAGQPVHSAPAAGPVPGHVPHTTGIPTAPPSGAAPAAPLPPQAPPGGYAASAVMPVHAAAPPGSGMVPAQGHGGSHGVHGMPPGAAPGMPPGPPPGMPPGPPPVGPGGPSGKRRRKKKAAPAKKSSLPLIRNVSLGAAGLVVLITIIGGLVGDKEKPAATVQEQVVEKAPCSEGKRAGRTDQEILQDAQRAFEKGEVYFQQWQVADDSLSVAIGAFCKAMEDLSLVDKSKWPAFTRDIQPAMAAAEEKVKREYSRIRINYNLYWQNKEYERAKEEMERAMVLIPDPNDERHRFARRKVASVKARMDGEGEKHRWEGRE